MQIRDQMFKVTTLQYNVSNRDHDQTGDNYD